MIAPYISGLEIWLRHEIWLRAGILVQVLLVVEETICTVIFGIMVISHAAIGTPDASPHPEEDRKYGSSVAPLPSAASPFYQREDAVVIGKSHPVRHAPSVSITTL